MRGLAWISAFLIRQRETMSRVANRNKQLPARRRISVDAIPWGIGGALYERNIPLSYSTDNIADHDTTMFSATTGDPAFNTLREGLAILVALRLCRNSNTTAVTPTNDVHSEWGSTWGAPNGKVV
jgi:hypothetical protein